MGILRDNIFRHVKDLLDKYQYDDGFTPLKELCQNASDAEAESLKIYIMNGISNAKHPLLRRKAIWVYNDGFVPDDVEISLEEIGTEEKTNKPYKIGEYGLGRISYFHLCDFFFYIINNKKVDYISPWDNSKGNKSPNLSWNNIIDEDKKLVLESIPTAMQGNGLIIIIPEKSENEDHVSNAHIDIENPFAKNEKMLINNFAIVLSLLYHTSKSEKKLKEISYHNNISTKKTDIKVSINPSNNQININILPTPIEYYTYSTTYPLNNQYEYVKNTQIRNWIIANFKQEELTDPHSVIEIIKVPKANKNPTLKIIYCIYLPLPNPSPSIELDNSINEDIYILLHCDFKSDSGRNGLKGYENLFDEFNNSDYEYLNKYKSKETFFNTYWNRLLAQDIVFPSIPEALYNAHKKNVLKNEELEKVIRGLSNCLGKNIFNYVVKEKGLAKCYSLKSSISLDWDLIDSTKPIVFIPQGKNEIIQKVFRFFDNNCRYVAKDDSYSVLPTFPQEKDNSEYINKIINNWSNEIVKNSEYTKLCKVFLETNKTIVNNNDISKKIKEKFQKILETCNPCEEDNDVLKQLFKYINDNLFKYGYDKFVLLTNIKSNKKIYYNWIQAQLITSRKLVFEQNLNKLDLLKTYSELIQTDIFMLGEEKYTLCPILKCDINGIADSLESNREKITDNFDKENFIKEIFDLNIPELDKYPYSNKKVISLYRYIITGFNNRAYNNNEEIYIVDPGHINSIWFKLFKPCKSNAIFIPDKDKYISKADYHLKKYYKELRITPMEDEKCYDIFKKYALEKNDISFLKDYTPDKQAEIVDKIFLKDDKELYKYLPFQKEVGTNEIIPELNEKCKLEIKTLSFPNGFKSQYTLIKLSDNERIKRSQEKFLEKIEKKDIFAEVIKSHDSFKYSNWIIDNISEYKHEFDTIEWIPTTSFGVNCTLDDILPGGIFDKNTSSYIREKYDFYSVDDLNLTNEQKTKLIKKIKDDLVSNIKLVYNMLIKKIEIKEQILIDIQETSFKSFINLFNESKIISLPNLLKLITNDKTFNQNFKNYDIFNDFYKKINVNNNSEKYIDLLNEIAEKKPQGDNEIAIFNSLIEKYLQRNDNTFLNKIKLLPTDKKRWETPEKIPNTRDNYPQRLYEETYEILKTKGLIVGNTNHYTTVEEDNNTNNLSFFNGIFSSHVNNKLYSLFLYILGNEYRKEAERISYNAKWSLFSSISELKFDSIEIRKIEVKNNYVTLPSIIPSLNISIPILDNLIFAGERYKKQIKDDISSHTLVLEMYESPNINVAPGDLTIDNVLKKEIFNIISVYENIDKNTAEEVRNDINNNIQLFLKTDQYGITDTQNQIKDEIFTQLNLMNFKNPIFKALYDEYSLSFSSNTSNRHERKDKLKDELVEKYIKNDQNFANDVLNTVITKITGYKYEPVSVLPELFQNADDCVNDIAKSNQEFEKYMRSFIVTYNQSNNVMSVSHFGRGINHFIKGSEKKYKYDLRNMISFTSDKSGSDTGKFGLGFKSVYTICDRPIVASKNLCFEIFAGVYPQQTTISGSKLSENETRFELELRQNANFKTLSKIFEDNIYLFLLFSKQINMISFCGNDYSPQLKEIVNEKIRFYKINSLCFLKFDLQSQKNIVFQVDDKLNKITPLEKNLCRIWELTPLFKTEFPNLDFAINAPFQINVGRTKADFENLDKEMLEKLGQDFGVLLRDLIDSKQTIFGQILDYMVKTVHLNNSVFKGFAEKAIATVYTEKQIIPTGWNGAIKLQDKITILSVTTGKYNDNPQDLLQPIQNYLDECKRGFYKIITNNAKESLPNEIKNKVDSFELSNSLIYIESKILTPVLLSLLIKIPGTQGNTLENIDKYLLINSLGKPKPCTEILLSDDAAPENTIAYGDNGYSDEIKEFLKNNPLFNTNNNALRIAVKEKKELMKQLAAYQKTSNIDTVLDFKDNDEESEEENEDNSTDYTSISLEYVYEKWHKLGEKKQKEILAQYYEKLVPQEFNFSEFKFTKPDKPENNDEDARVKYKKDLAQYKLEWFILFFLGVYQCMGWHSVDTTIKNFIKQISDLEDGQMINYLSNKKPSENKEKWIEMITEFCKTPGQKDNELYFHWMSPIPKLIKVWEYSDIYEYIFTRFNSGDSEPFTLKRDMLTPETNEALSGTDFEYAPTLQRTLWIGASLIIRELILHKAIKREGAMEHAYMPKEGIVQAVFNIDKHDYKKNYKNTDSRQIYEQLLEVLKDETKATFDGYYDIPLLIRLYDKNLWKEIENA